jgi:hypothetical protein
MALTFQNVCPCNQAQWVRSANDRHGAGQRAGVEEGGGTGTVIV